MWFWIILAVTAILVSMVIYSSNYMFEMTIARPSPTSDPSDFVDMEAYLKGPHHRAVQEGLKFLDKQTYEDVYITAFDGIKLHALLYMAPGGNSEKFAIGIHGFRSNPKSEYAPHLEYYFSKGYNMLLTDDRAHGRSEGNYVGMGNLDRLDCISWAEYLVKRFGENTEILLHGVSMGAAAVISASGEDSLPSQVKGVVADCGFSGIKAELNHEVKQFAGVPPVLFIPFTEMMCVHNAGYNFKRNTPLELVKKARVPIFFVHGKDDKMVPVSMAQEMYDACPTEKRLLIVENAGHADSIAVAPDRYHQNMEELFNL